MNNTIQPNDGLWMYSVPPKAREAKPIGSQSSRFLDLVDQVSQSRINTSRISSNGEQMNAYMAHLKSKYGQITIASIPKDQASLDKAGGRMSGNDVVIAPNMLADMANDPKKAGYYEQKIDDFFHAVPKLQAQFTAKGLNYEPCGVIIHEDGTVTYISGCGDSPERVAEVNAINYARDAKRAAQRKEYQDQAMTAADFLHLLSKKQLPN